MISSVMPSLKYSFSGSLRQLDHTRLHQRLYELLRVGEALAGHLGEHLVQRSVHVLGHGGLSAASGRYRRAEALRDNGVRSVPGVRRLTHEHLVKHTAQGVEVAAAVERLLATCLLRAHVRGRPHRDPRLGDVLYYGFPTHADRPRHPEVGHHGVPPGQHDVGGLDVPVYHVMTVRITQRARHLACNVQGRFHFQPLLAVDPLPQRLSLHKRHDVVQQAVGLTGVVYGQYMGVRQLRRDPDLSQEPLGSDRHC
jgi:hypothetical protein